MGKEDKFILIRRGGRRNAENGRKTQNYKIHTQTRTHARTHAHTHTRILFLTTLNQEEGGRGPGRSAVPVGLQ